mgnify:CR=1 FL=1
MHLNAHRSDLNDAPTRSQIWMRRLTLLALLLAAGVIILGAWTRLSDAGLGCPDWPGCAPTWTKPVPATTNRAGDGRCPQIV